MKTPNETTGTKGFTCPVCGRGGFKSEHALKVHMGLKGHTQRGAIQGEPPVEQRFRPEVEKTHAEVLLQQELERVTHQREKIKKALSAFSEN